jgi:hypothetical protein
MDEFYLESLKDEQMFLAFLTTLSLIVILDLMCFILRAIK